MRIQINLATRPFVELRPLLARLRLAMAGCALLAVVLGFALHALSAKARTAQAQMDALKGRTAAFQSERQRNEARMRQPQNHAVLERSQFLNSVFAHKSFSWTAVMMDLERVLPSGVQVTSIEPQVAATDGTVTIRLRVSGDRDRAVQLVRNLETSARFVHPRLSGEAVQATDASVRNASMQAGAAQPVPGAVEVEILSGYNPLATLAKAPRAPGSGSSDVPSVKGSKTSGSRRRAAKPGAGVSAGTGVAAPIPAAKGRGR